MVERISISTAEAAILTDGALDNDGFAHLQWRVGRGHQDVS